MKGGRMGRYENFVDRWGEHERGCAKLLYYWVTNNFNPHSVIDIGCGSGVFLLDYFNANIEVVGVDFEANARKWLSDSLVIHDLTKPLYIKKKYDLAMSIEVIEHIEQEYEDIVVKTIADASDLLLFSGAKPNQIGENHINCQTKEYWIKKFEQHNFTLWLHKSNDLIDFMNSQNEFLKCPWLVENLMILKKDT